MIRPILLGLTLAQLAVVADAQEAPAIRQSIDPSVLREQQAQGRTPRVKPVTPPPAAPLPAPQPGEVQFVLKAIRFDGLGTGMPAAEAFARDYAALIGQPTTLAALESVAARATARLRAAGATCCSSTTFPASPPKPSSSLTRPRKARRR